MNRRHERSVPQRASSNLPSAGPHERATFRPNAELRVADEGTRTRLIGDISRLIREPAIPDSARSAGLELIGWLARRMPGEAPHALGVQEAQVAERSARRKPR